MNQYYYVDAYGKQSGPVSKQELRAYNVTRQTMVWCEGMPGWAPAGSVADLNEIFAFVPPAPPSPSPYNQTHQMPVQQQQKPNSYMWLGICTTLLCCLPLGLVSIFYASKVDTCMAQGDYNGAVNNSNNARTWGIISAIVGLLVGFLAFVAGMAGA